MNRLLLLLLTARLMALVLRVRHGRAFPFEKIAGVQTPGVPQKYQMHFVKRNIDTAPRKLNQM